MANYFLGSVGRAEAFRYNAATDKYDLAFVSNTLTDQAINISTSQDELRAGTGAPVVATFTHDTTAEITLTDVFWKKEYIGAQLGLEWKRNASAFQTEEHDVANNKINLKKTPIAIAMGCNSSEVMVWVNEAGSSEKPECVYEIAGKEVTLDAKYNGKHVCVRYLADNDPEATSAMVYTSVVPEELYLIVTTPIYAGDACAASNGRKAGELQFVVKRFKLNGAQDFSFAMSSNTTMSLAGKALASMTSCDPQENGLIEIKEVIIGQKEKDGLKAIYFENGAPYESEMEQNTVIKVYGVYSDNSVALLDSANIDFSPAGKVVNGRLAESMTATQTLTAKYYADIAKTQLIDEDSLTVIADPE